MIPEIFGKPSLPQKIIEGCIILPDGLHIQVGEILFFENRPFLKLYRIGNECGQKLIPGRNRITGYFSCSHQLIDQINVPCKIIGENKSPDFCLSYEFENAILVKTITNLPELRVDVKFVAKKLLKTRIFSQCNEKAKDSNGP
jgi:hypothetical protein